MISVFLNGKFVERDAATISAFDAGFQHGVGLFETMLGVPGRIGPAVVALGEHMTRLCRSAATLGLSNSLREDALSEAVLETVRRSGLAAAGGRARVRLTITGGDLSMLARPGAQAKGAQDPTILIVAQPATEYPSEMFSSGVTATIADLKLNPLDPFAGHKALNYWARLRELQNAATKRAGEALVFQITNHLAGGCVSNAFLVKDGVLLTPIARGEEQEVGAESSAGTPDAPTPTPGPRAGGAVIPSPVLPGVTRAMLMRCAHENGVRTERRMLTIHDVLGADELFLVNSSWGVLPVVQVEGEPLGAGAVGDLTRHAREWWNNEVASCE